MIRRKLSAGLLRASAQAQAQASVAPPASPAGKGLASAVLLSSQRNWAKETVVSLKGELKSRGLSQAGNKAVLIARLQNAETSLPPVPPLPASLRPRSNSLPSTSRALSTTAALSFPPKRPAATKGSAKPPADTAVSGEKVTSQGPAVSTQKTEAESKSEVTEAEVTVAPGLPETKDVTLGGDGRGMTLQMPDMTSSSEVEQVIPLTPDNFRSNDALPSSSTADAAPESDTADLPKVMTVASASTHPAGGPSHAVHSSSDAHTHEMTVAEAASEIAASAPINVPSFSSMLGAPARAFRAAGLGSLVPDIGAPKGGEKSGEYKAPSKGLDEHEKRGAWVLAGVVGLGLLLGGGGARGSKKEKKSKGLDVAKGESGGVKGDKDWEKASGAGVVGHGKRKD